MAQLVSRTSTRPGHEGVNANQSGCENHGAPREGLPAMIVTNSIEWRANGTDEGIHKAGSQSPQAMPTNHNVKNTRNVVWSGM